MKRWKKIAIGAGATLGLLGVAGYIVYGGGKHEGPGVVTPRAVPDERVAERRARQPSPPADTQILFGDLHVHTTFSADAFMRSLPLAGGEGAHPPADACDFARFCSQLDFFALTDHAEALTPRHWAESKESVRQCNAVAGDPQNPDLVAFTGFEWTQVGQTPEEHYGHKNVIFRGTAEDELPARPIAATGPIRRAFDNPGVSMWTMATIPLRDFSRRQRYLDLAVYRSEVLAVDDCPEGVDTRELPAGCREVAATPQVLFEKLSQWGFDATVIPHGTTWGFYTPPGYAYDKQLTDAQDDPERQRLIEVFSGHGNSEEYRPWRAVTFAADGTAECPEPTDGFEPCCWRAGELIRARCGDIPAEECERRVAEARRNHAAAGVAGHLTVPGATVEDWGNCGQCTDCFAPSFNYRPGGSVQYILALGGTLGSIASSDNHSARPGTGYKELERRKMGDASGPESEHWRDLVMGEPPGPTPESEALPDDAADTRAPFKLLNLERQASFFMTGGLVAVHSRGRDRDAIWDALSRREVYGTSGERILLWFDLVNAPGGARPMGAEVALGDAPRFAVRALGAFAQKDGCPAWTADRLGPERIERLCTGECYFPSDTRRRITRIEVVRIRPRRSAGEPLAPLIEDPWRTFECPDDAAAGCTAEFDDPEFAAGARDVVYYVRAIQEPTPAVNAEGLRCDGDDCDPCYGDWRTPFEDDCLGDNEERAWSSPIFVRYREPPGNGRPEEVQP